MGITNVHRGYAAASMFVIGTAGEVGFGVGVCPFDILPSGMVGLTGYAQIGHDNYGNYQYADGSIMVWIPKYYYKITAGTNTIKIKGTDTFADETAANASGYAIHRTFIDGGIEQKGFFIDKYMYSKNAMGAGFVASSIKNGDPISTIAAHNPVADLTACATNHYYQLINAAHARDGVDGATNANSIFCCSSKFHTGALALLSYAHGQAASSVANCAWYHATFNYPKGCNNNALGDSDDDTISYTSDGYSNCGKTGSGTPFAKTTHNGQASGVADLNGLMWEVNPGVTCVATAVAIEGITSAATPVFTWTGHSLSVGDYVMILAITQADWANLKNKIWKVATTPDADTFTLETAPDTTGYAAYDAGTDPGTFTKGTWYAAKPETAMKDFTSGNSTATDHWGATGVAAMMEEFTPAFETAYFGNGFAQRFGSGGNQVLSENIFGTAWLLSGIGFPKDKDGIDTTGTNAFGKDYYCYPVGIGTTVRLRGFGMCIGITLGRTLATMLGVGRACILSSGAIAKRCGNS
jgi:hypothetical protein